MAEMGQRILQAANLTVEAVRMMAALRGERRAAQHDHEQIIHLEEDSDALNHKASRRCSCATAAATP